MITLQRAIEVFHFDVESGLLYWRVSMGKAKRGSVAGRLMADGYRQVTLDKRQYLAHRIVWMITNGSMPNSFIDHINGVRDDNRTCNLRLATAAENQQNRRAASKNNKSGFLGVVWHKRNKKWEAQIKVSGKTKHLGSFDTAETAHDAYILAKREVHAFCTI